MAKKKTYHLMKRNVKYHVKKLEEARETLQQMANGEFLPGDCPLAHDHLSLTHIIFGIENYHWECGFCGKEESV